MKLTIRPIIFIATFFLLGLTQTFAQDSAESKEAVAGMPGSQVIKLYGEPDKKIERGNKGAVWVYYELPRNVYLDNKDKVQFVTIPKQQVSVSSAGKQSDGYQKYITKLIVAYSGKIGDYRAKVNYNFASTQGLVSTKGRTKLTPAAMKVNGTIELTTEKGTEKIVLNNVIFTNDDNILGGGLLVSQSPSSLSSSIVKIDKSLNLLKLPLADVTATIDQDKPIVLLRLNSDFTLSLFTEE